jgi:hypothetical protein
MNEQLLELVRFCNADQVRFMEIGYMPDYAESGPSLGGHWEVSICLGEHHTCARPRVVGVTRWLEVKAPSYQMALQRAVDRLSSVRELKRAA